MKTMTKFANKLLFLSAVLLLLCGSVVGERGGSRQRRRAKSSKSKDKSKGDESLKSSKSTSGESDPGTPPPTSADSISSKSSKFAITYSPIDDVPTSEDLAELTMMTHKYLEDFMLEFFDKTALTDLDNFLTIMVRDIFVEGEPVLAEYQSNGLFNPVSIFIPVTRELDNLIEDAITQDEYLEMVNALPRSNPFRGTEKISKE